MNKKRYFLLSGTVWLFIWIWHGLMIFLGVHEMFGEHVVPRAVSVVGILIASPLILYSFAYIYILDQE